MSLNNKEILPYNIVKYLVKSLALWVKLNEHKKMYWILEAKSNFFRHNKSYKQILKPFWFNGI